MSGDTYTAALTPVKVDGGLVSGVEWPNANVRAYLGLPYAAAPVGALRWRPPQPVAPWSGVRAADTLPPQCVQPGRSTESVYFEFAGVQPMSEDCLYMNVWTPAASADAGLPVMVWFHGGGFQQGSGANPVFVDGDLPAQGVVLVTFNYRLGPFGFMAHPAFSAEAAEAGSSDSIGVSGSGNYGLRDMDAMLRWVQRNIAAFGGDPARVTIFGQSAGAAGVINMMASPRTEGLYAHAIAQSFGVTGMESLADAERSGAAFAESIGATTAEALRAVPAQELLDSYLARPERWMPIADGDFIARPVREIFAAGEQVAVPLLTGWNADEGSTFGFSRDLASFEDKLAKRFGDRLAQAQKLYPATTDAGAKAASLSLVGDELFASGVHAAVRSHTRKAPSWLYYFDHLQPFKPGQRYRESGDAEPAKALGVFHSSEYAYIFGTTGVLTRDWGADDARVTQLMQRIWLNFARTGNPNGEGVPQWPTFDEHSRSMLRLAAAPALIDLPRLAQLELVG
ncbi:carboxylesterase family protein [soil metagenome]